ncbi:MAG TPA: replication-relaxation family protein [Xanthobacteraceae bacterium]|jgi:hypothetical protein|nr:replication-relaxation family protein [Xanthobacteraceae bacterium]
MKDGKNYDRFSNDPVLNEDGKPIVSQWVERNPLIIKALADHAILNFDDLAAIVGGNRHSLYRTVRILKARNNGYIALTHDCLKAKSLRRPLVFHLTQKGVEWAKENNTVVTAPKRVAPGYEDHAMLTAHVVASIHTGVAQQPPARIVSWDEIKSHPKFGTGLEGQSVWPDTHPFRIELINNGKPDWRTLVIEADNGTESIKRRIKEKFQLYKEFMDNKEYIKRYGVSNYYVLFVFTKRARLDHSKQLLEEMGGNRFILFQQAYQDPSIPAGYIFMTPCERAGYPSLQLNQL